MITRLASITLLGVNFGGRKRGANGEVEGGKGRGENKGGGGGGDEHPDCGGDDDPGLIYVGEEWAEGYEADYTCYECPVEEGG